MGSTSSKEDELKKRRAGNLKLEPLYLPGEQPLKILPHSNCSS